MDLPSFKNGYCLKRLQRASQTFKNQTLKLLLALKKTQEDVGRIAAISMYVDLKNLKPTCSNKTMTQKLDKAEEELLDLAHTVIGLICIPNSENQ